MRTRKILKWSALGVIAAAVLIIVLALALGGSKNTPTSSVTCNPLCPGQSSSSAAATDSSAGPSPTPSAQFQAQTLMNISGNGNFNTQKFTVGGSGDYDVWWSYSAGAQMGTANFNVEADNSSDINFTGPNQLGAGSSGVIHVYNDAGTHYLTVSTEAASWTLKVVTAP